MILLTRNNTGRFQDVAHFRPGNRHHQVFIQKIETVGFHCLARHLPGDQLQVAALLIKAGNTFSVFYALFQPVLQDLAGIGAGNGDEVIETSNLDFVIQQLH